MGKRSGNSGCLVLALLPIAFVMGKCSGGSHRPVDPVDPPASFTSAQVDPPSPVLDERFIAIDRLNVRTSPNGGLAGHLDRGERVEVHERRDGWARISEDGAPTHWVFERHLCSGQGCAPARPSTNAGPKPAHRSAPPRTHWSGDSDDGCPCSSSRNCIGPRGGRYCITSGGNKRYR